MKRKLANEHNGYTVITVVKSKQFVRRAHECEWYYLAVLAFSEVLDFFCNLHSRK